MAEIEYLLGHDERELRRLELQAGIFAPGTERILRAAGLGPGMSVLDVGTGVGDVAMLVAGIVGPNGSVLGIDREPSAVERACARSDLAGLPNVSFQAATMEALSGSERFDAVIGRYVLLYQSDRVGFLARAAQLLRTGGTLLLIEPGFSVPESLGSPQREYWSEPPAPLYDLVFERILFAFALSGARGRTGAGFVELFSRAGLGEPTLLHEIPSSGPDSAFAEWIYLTLLSVMPLLERHGAPMDELGDLATLQTRMQAEVSVAPSQMRGPDLIGGWTKVG